MNPDYLFALLCMQSIFVACVIVLFIQKYALLHRQLRNVISHHENLRQRFGLFMLRGGQEVMLKHANDEWQKQQCLAKPVPGLSASLPNVEHYSFPGDEGPITLVVE